MNADGPKLERVLCALDLDGSTQGPLAVAGLMAQGFRASLDALYVPLPLPAFSGRVERVRRLIAEHGKSERLSALLSPFTRSFRVDPYVTRGRASEVILEHALRHHSDLIVMGAGGSALLGKRGGGITLPVASAAGCPVLTIAKRSVECAMRRVLVPVGSASEAAGAVAWAGSIARRFQAEVQLVAVPPARPGLWSSWLRAELPAVPRSHARRRRTGMQDFTAKLRHAGVKASERRLAAEDPSELVALTRSGEFDLVVLGVHAAGHETSAGQILSRTLREQTDVPVLSVPVVGLHAALARSRRPRDELAQAALALPV